jgi:CCR4-NOT transcriptional regulation complex NOT5 subunit
VLLLARRRVHLEAAQLQGSTDKHQLSIAVEAEVLPRAIKNKETINPSLGMTRKLTLSSTKNLPRPSKASIASSESKMRSSKDAEKFVKVNPPLLPAKHSNLKWTLSTHPIIRSRGSDMESTSGVAKLLKIRGESYTNK